MKTISIKNRSTGSITHLTFAGKYSAGSYISRSSFSLMRELFNLHLEFCGLTSQRREDDDIIERGADIQAIVMARGDASQGRLSAICEGNRSLAPF